MNEVVEGGVIRGGVGKKERGVGVGVGVREIGEGGGITMRNPFGDLTRGADILLLGITGMAGTETAGDAEKTSIVETRETGEKGRGGGTRIMVGARETGHVLLTPATTFLGGNHVSLFVHDLLY